MSERILLLGASGYIGDAFVQELNRRQWTFRTVARTEVDYTRFSALRQLVSDWCPTFLVNCAGYTGKPNVDACETHRADTLLGNVVFPQTIQHVCELLQVPWGHVSSGCIYSGSKWREPDGSFRIERDLTRSDLWQRVLDQDTRLVGFDETDPPNFSFRAPPCSFYSGTKALGEEVLPSDAEQFIWRLRIPFDHLDNKRNYLSKLQNYPRVYENVNSISHRGDFAWACMELWARRADFGIYHVTNPGYVTSSQVVRWIQAERCPDRTFEFWRDDSEFYKEAACTPRSNCILDTRKLERAGVVLRSVEDAVIASLRSWQPSPR